MILKVTLSVGGETVIFDAEIENFSSDDAEIEIEEITLRKEKIIEYLQRIIKLLEEVDVIE